MSALARYFLSEGWKVSGSDLSPSGTTDELKKEGVAVYIGKQSANNIQKSGPSLVIYNNAIPKENPELIAAEKSGAAVRSYPEIVGELTKKYKTIAVAGSHGKSTTTAMVSLILIEAGLDPTIIIGTKLKELGGKNFRKGNSGWLVLEADEWRAAFLNYHPYVAAITNIDKEHLDFYKNFANVQKTFEQFKERCETVVERSTNPKLAAEIKKVLKIPGDHNVNNALNAYAIADYLDIPRQTILKALGKYRGAWRRMEYRGTLSVNRTSHSAHLRTIRDARYTIRVFDDYAHHPSEIRATLAAFKQKWPKNPLICVFQAHQAHRLKALFNDFKTAFKAADRVILFPTYIVAGREQELDKKRSSEALARVVGAEYLKNPKDLKKILIKVVSALNPKLSPIIVMMGAGDIINYTENLVS